MQYRVIEKSEMQTRNNLIRNVIIYNRTKLYEEIKY